MKRISIAILMTLVFNTMSFEQLKNASKITKRIETYLSEFEKVGFAGTVLVEINENKVISKAYGFRNAELKEKNTPNTIFDIGSLTKQFTAAADLEVFVFTSTLLLFFNRQ